MPHLVATALTGAALALLPAVPAGVAAAEEAAPAAPASSLRLTLTRPGDASGARSVTLLCEPAGGTHPQAGKACAELSRSAGKFEREADGGTACVMIYSPVIAEARGHWHGRPVRFRAEYGNDCAMAARTGSVFRF